MSQERAEHVNNVRERMRNSRRNEADANANSRTSVWPPGTHQPPRGSQPSHSHVPQPSTSTLNRPVIGPLHPVNQGQPPTGLSQAPVDPGLPRHQVNQPGPHPAMQQPGPTIIPVQTGGAPLPPAQAGGVPAPPGPD